MRLTPAKSEERLTILAAGVLATLAVAWCAMAWRYLDQQRSELERARAGAVRLAESTMQDFIGFAQAGGMRAIIAGTAEAFRPSAGDLRKAAERTLERLEMEPQLCRCGVAAPEFVLVVSFDSQKNVQALASVGASAASDMRSVASVVIRELGGADEQLRTTLAEIGGRPMVLHIRPWTSARRVAAVTVVGVRVAEIVQRAFLPVTDSLRQSLLPLHSNRDSVLRFIVRTVNGRQIFPEAPMDGNGAGLKPQWTDSASGSVVTPSRIGTFLGSGLQPIVLRERPFWTVANPLFVATVAIDVDALHYGVAGTRRPVPVNALRVSMVAVVLMAALGFFALHRARRMMRARTLFFSGISHELRTPLTQVLLYGEALQAGGLTPAEHDRAQNVIVRETRRLVHMIENVLLLARGGARNIPLNFCSANLSDVVADAIESMQLLLDRHRCAVQWDGNYATVWVDTGAVRQIVVNLIDNALRYGPAGQCISVVVRGLDGGATVTVRDQGPGIPRRDRRRVFSPFEKGSSAVGANGTGIGLALVKQLVVAMHGWVRIDDSTEPGLSISVWFPSTERRDAAAKLTS